jgi:hypothetical protein
MNLPVTARVFLRFSCKMRLFYAPAFRLFHRAALHGLRRRQCEPSYQKEETEAGRLPFLLA